MPVIDAIRTGGREAVELLMPETSAQNNTDHCGWTILDWANLAQNPEVKSCIATRQGLR